MIFLSLFVFFLLLENLFLPAIIGIGPFMITPLFLLGTNMYIPEFRFRPGLFLILAALFSGVNVIVAFSAFLITVGIYLVTGHFLDIRLGSDRIFSVSNIIRESLILLSLGLIYSWLFIFLESAHDLYSTSNEWLILARTSGLYFFMWSIVLSILLAHVSKKK